MLNSVSSLSKLRLPALAAELRRRELAFQVAEELADYGLVSLRMKRRIEDRMADLYEDHWQPVSRAAGWDDPDAAYTAHMPDLH